MSKKPPRLYILRNSRTKHPVRAGKENPYCIPKGEVLSFARKSVAKAERSNYYNETGEHCFVSPGPDHHKYKGEKFWTGTAKTL